MHLFGIQLLLLGLTSLGWGLLIHRIAGGGALLTPRRAGLLLIAGYAVQILILLNLTYLDIRIRNAWLIAAVPGGIAVLVTLRSVTNLARCAFNKSRWAILALAAVMSLHSYAIFVKGPHNYAGAGYIDQLNYTLQTQFLLERPLSTPFAPESVTHEPWLLKGLQSKDGRLGQSVAFAYLAAMTGADAHESYAATVIWMIGLLGLSTYLAARSFAVPRYLAALAAAWVCLTPAVSETHIFGFLSQTAALFTVPALVAVSRAHGAHRYERAALSVVILSYLFVTYTEFAALGLATYGLLTVLGIRRRLVPRLAEPALVILLSLVIVPAYLPRAIDYLNMQASFALSRDAALEGWSPASGTFYGWAASLVRLPAMLGGIGSAIVVTAGALIVLLSVLSLASRGDRTRWRIAAMSAPPLLLGLWMLWQPVLTKYAFYKLVNNSAWLFVLLATIGAARTMLGVRKSGHLKAALNAAYVCLVLMAGSGAMAFQYNISRRDTPYASLQTLASAQFQESAQAMRRHPERVYVIRENKDFLAAGWLAYHGRKSKVFVDSDRLSDMILLPRGKWFPLVDYTIPGLTIVGLTTFKSEQSTPDLPIVELENAQGEERDDKFTWYWVGKSLKVRIVHWAASRGDTHVALQFRATTGPAHPSASRTFEVVRSDGGFRTRFSYSGIENVSVCLPIRVGVNEFEMTVVEPERPSFVGGPDPRVLMDRIDSVRVAWIQGCAGDSLKNPMVPATK